MTKFGLILVYWVEQRFLLLLGRIRELVLALHRGGFPNKALWCFSHPHLREMYVPPSYSKMYISLYYWWKGPCGPIYAPQRFSIFKLKKILLGVSMYTDGVPSRYDQSTIIDVE